MNPEIKTQWLQALRSGDYTQGTETLTRIETDGTRKHCCLGVLCDLAVKAGIPVEALVASSYGQRVAYDGNISVLPDLVTEWAGLIEANPVVLQDVETPIGRRDFALAELNDGSETCRIPSHSFAEIANIIEEKL